MARGVRDWRRTRRVAVVSRERCHVDTLWRKLELIREVFALTRIAHACHARVAVSLLFAGVSTVHPEQFHGVFRVDPLIPFSAGGVAIERDNVPYSPRRIRRHDGSVVRAVLNAVRRVRVQRI